MDNAGNIFIADSPNNRIREVFGPNPPPGRTAGNIITVAGNGKAGFRGDGGPATSASLNFPTGVSMDSTGNLFIADEGNDRIREVFGANPPAGQTAGNIITVAGGGKSPGTCAGSTNPMGDGCAATSASLTAPIGIFVDSKGNLFIADSRNDRIREVVQSRESR